MVESCRLTSTLILRRKLSSHEFLSLYSEGSNILRHRNYNQLDSTVCIYKRVSNLFSTWVTDMQYAVRLVEILTKMLKVFCIIL